MRIKFHSRRAVFVGIWTVVFMSFILWKHPDFWADPEEHYKRALELRTAGRPDEALKELNSALRLAPGKNVYLVSKGYLQLEMGLNQQASETFLSALAGSAQDVEASLGLATALLELGRRDESTKVLTDMGGAAFGAPQVYRRGRLYARMGCLERAYDDFAHALESNPESSELLMEAIQAASGIQLWDAVLTLCGRLERARGGDAFRVEMLHHRALAFQMVGRPQESLDTYGEIASPENQGTRARLHLQLGQYASAVPLLDQAAVASPSDVSVKKDLAWALQKSGNSPAAEEAYRSMIESGNGDAEIRVRYAWMLNEQKRYAEAWKVLSSLPKPSSETDILEVQARTAFWAGKMDEASKLLSLLIERKSNEASHGIATGEGYENAHAQGNLDLETAHGE